MKLHIKLLKTTLITVFYYTLCNIEIVQLYLQLLTIIITQAVASTAQSLGIQTNIGGEEESHKRNSLKTYRLVEPTLEPQLRLKENQ